MAFEGFGLMSHDEVLARLTSLFRDVLDDDSVTLKDDSSARTVPGWDSVANIRLMLSIEEEYGFKFGMDEYAEFRNVGDLVSGIQRRVGQPAR
jgi:acyl carrier protein